MRDIGKNIKALRQAKGLTQDDLAEKLFVTRQTVSNYETGRSRPDVDMLVTIAQALGTDPNTVLYGPAPEQKSTYRPLAIGAVLTAAAGLLAVGLRGVSQELYYDFWMSPIYGYYGLLMPAFLTLLGWTALCALCALLKPRPLKASWLKYVRWGLLAVLAAYVVLLLPVLADALRIDLIALSHRRQRLEFSSMEHRLPEPLNSIVHNPVSNYILLIPHRLMWVFPVLGAGVFLTGFTGHKREI